MLSTRAVVEQSVVECWDVGVYDEARVYSESDAGQGGRVRGVGSSLALPLAFPIRESPLMSRTMDFRCYVHCTSNNKRLRPPAHPARGNKDECGRDRDRVGSRFAFAKSTMPYVVRAVAFA